MNIIAIIPARSGSKSVKDKNIKLLANRPLLSYAIEAACGCPYIDQVFVSTDSPSYGRLAMNYGAKYVERPKPLAEDVPTEDVIKHVIKTIEPAYGKTNLIVTLQCTTPLTIPEDITKGITAIVNTSADSAMTVCEVHEFPQWMFRKKNWRLEPFMNAALKGEWGVRQTHEQLYRPTGGVYVSTRNLVMEKNRIIGDNCFPIEVPYLRGWDIDSEADFKIIEAIIKSGLV